MLYIKSMTSINDLQNDPKNARKRTDRSAKLIKQSLEQYGAARSIVIDENNRILAGNGTIAGAKAAGIKNLKIIEADGDEIIAVKRSNLTEDQKVGLAIADNRTGDLSEWDVDMLEQLSKEHDLNEFFDKKELDDILSKKEVLPTEGLTDPDEVPETPEEPITKEGDLYILGNHRLLCGDSTNILHVEKLMDGSKADMVFTDPPYNINFSGTMSNTSRNGKLIPHQGMNSKYNSIHNDKKSSTEFKEFISEILNIISLKCKGAYYITFNSANLHELLNPIALSIGYKSIIIWMKNQSPMGGGAYRRRYEPIVYGNFSKNFYGVPYSEDDIWQFDRTNKNDLHPTMKPVDLIINALKHGCINNEIVLDLFGGSGSTLIAAERLKRQAFLMELDPKYCDVIVKRWEDFTGNTAKRVSSS
jgi:DNA modification methylase